MRAVIQRVHSVQYQGEDGAGAITKGYLIYLGVAHGDTEDSARILADKISLVRSYQDEAGEWDRHLRDIHGDVMIILEPDILARCIRGRRPIYNAVAALSRARALTECFALNFSKLGLHTAYLIPDKSTSVIADLDGPVTFIVDTADL